MREDQAPGRLSCATASSRRSWYSGPPRTSENSSESSASGRSLMGPLNSSQRGFQRTWAYVAFQSPSPDRPDLQPVFVRRLDQRDDVALVTLSENDLAVRQSGALAP